MPNIKSAKKRMRTSEQSRLRNRAVKTNIKNIRRSLLEIKEETPKSDAEQVYRRYCSALDKAAKKGTLNRNTAIRRKRRAALRLSAKPTA